MSVVDASVAASFWAAIEDCLLEFHHLGRGDAAEKVTGLWRRLSKCSSHPSDTPSFEDMIYHAEPWYIACNLAEKDVPLEEANRGAYQDILKRHGLA